MAAPPGPTPAAAGTRRVAFLRQFLIYGLAGAASRLAALILVPLYTHALSVPEYGTLELLLAIHALVVLMGGLQVESAVARDYLQALEGGSAQAYKWTALFLTLVGTSAVGGVLLLAWWIHALPADLSGTSMLWLAALTAPVQLFSVQLIMLRFSGHAKAFASLSFSDLSLSALFSWVFIVPLDEGLNGALMGLLAGKLVCLAAAWPMTFGWPRWPRWQRDTARGMLAYGLPSLPAVFVNWLQNTGNRVLLASVLTVQDVALAGLAVKMSSLYGFVVYSFRLAWEPYAMARLDGADGAGKGFDRALEGYVATMFLACGLAVGMGPAVVDILSPASYAAAGVFGGLFIVGQFWVGATNVLVIGIHGARQPSRLLPVYALGVSLNVLLLLSLARPLGGAAAGFGFLVGAVASALLAAYYSNTLYGTGFSWRLLGASAIGSATLLAAFQAALAHRPAAGSRLFSAAVDLGIGTAVSLPLTIGVLWLGIGNSRCGELLNHARGYIARRQGVRP